MKKFLSYKSLNEQEDFINKMIYEKNKIDRPIISDDIKRKIDNILINYHNQILNITFFEDGYIYSQKAKIIKIDTIYKKIYLTEHNGLDFKNILDVNLLDSNDFF